MTYACLLSWPACGLAALYWMRYHAHQAGLTLTQIFSYLAGLPRSHTTPLSPTVMCCICAVIVACGPVTLLFQLGDALKNSRK